MFELAIIKLLAANSLKDNSLSLNSKVVYMAPTKALCTERYIDWRRKFQALNCTVGLLTGDSSLVELTSIRDADLIICTPEKWDALTRRWSDYNRLFTLVRLLLVDEIHFLRERRGTSLEVVMTRMLAMPSLRIIALSATIPNIYDISNWLGNSTSGSTSRTIKTLVYDDSYRAVTLKKVVYGYKTAYASNPFIMENYYNMKLQEVLKVHSKNKPVLIFCPTRNSAVTTAKYLANRMSTVFHYSSSFRGNNKELMVMLPKGVAFHHAGLSIDERQYIETSFIKGHIKILCSTSTLAVGVNLPAYLVIIKGTKFWNNESLEEYNELTLMQMLGRAGRPQFEKEGTCVIMTDYSLKDRYLGMVKGTEKLESSLHLNIYENITAEIALKTISSLDTAFSWLQSTFFYQRYLKNPSKYPIINSTRNSKNSSPTQLKLFLKRVLDELVKEQIIELTNKKYRCTVYGQALRKSYVFYDTIKSFIKAKPRLTLDEVMLMISKSAEFVNLKLKMTQKKLYKNINKNLSMFYTVNDFQPENYWDKVMILIHFELGGIEFPFYQGSENVFHEFVSEKMMVFKNLPRIIRAAIEVFSHKKDAISTCSILKLNRCIYSRSWENSPLILKQFRGIGLAYAKKLFERGITDISKVKRLSREKLDLYLGLNPRLGEKIFKSINQMPELNLDIKNLICKNDGFVQFDIIVGCVNAFGEISYIWNDFFVHINVLTDVSGTILDFRRLSLNKLAEAKQFTLQTSLKFKSDYVRVYFNCDEIAGIGKQIQLDTFAATIFLPKKPEIALSSEASFEFDEADDEALNVVFAKELALDKHSDNERNPDTYFVAVGKDSKSEFVFNACAHKCSDKGTCRHICCKNGAMQNVIKGCKHACKDKRKCMHKCCREQPERVVKTKENNLTNKTDFFHPQYMVSEGTKASDVCAPIFLAENISDNTTITSVILQSPNNCSHTAPAFLECVDIRKPELPDRNTGKDSRPKVQYSKMVNSKHRVLRFEPPEEVKNKRFLDDSESDEFSDSLDNALHKVFKTRKRIKPIVRGRIQSGNTTSNIEKVNNDATSVKEGSQRLLNVSSKSSDSNSATTALHTDSLDDIVIMNQKLPKIISCPTALHTSTIFDLNDIDKQGQGIKENANISGF